jgi:hypothetical protein
MAAALMRLSDALFTIGTECENFTGTSNCISAGRMRGADYLADAWCHGCIARDALFPANGEVSE